MRFDPVSPRVQSRWLFSAPSNQGLLGLLARVGTRCREQVRERRSRPRRSRAGLWEDQSRWKGAHAIDGAAFSNAINLAAATHYGHALRAFLEKLTVDPRNWSEEFERFKRLLAFMASGGDGQVIRAASRFALIALAGEVAGKYGVVPWPEGEAIKASATMFDRWLAARRGGNREPHQIREAVSDFIDKHGAGRFPTLYATGIDDRQSVRDRAAGKRPMRSIGSAP
jgi:uncharacterized protein (DUF927 family)